MSSLSDDQVRHLILEILHKQAKESPRDADMNKVQMIDFLKIPENQMDFNINYLEEKGLLTLISSMQGWHCAKITAFGIDVIENKEIFKSDFPFIAATIQVQGDNYGNIVQATNNSTVIFSQQVSDAFNKAYEMIDGKADITSEQKTEIKENAKFLEEELRKTEPDACKIQQFWKWLKRNADWLVPTLTPVVMEGIKVACGGS